LRINFALLSGIIFLSFSSSLWAQSFLYEKFEYDMRIQEAKALLKKNKKRFKSITLGSGTSYAIRRTSLKQKNQKVYAITLTSKKNLTLKETTSYLKKSRLYYEKLGYVVVYADPNWYAPLLRDPNKPCVRLVDQERKKMIEFEPIGQGAIYNLYITIYNYDWFVEKITGKSKL
tara:strand:- start:1026 stop:1547 length:522 start_codon:yes stop_codon:yes gene_type:complete